MGIYNPTILSNPDPRLRLQFSCIISLREVYQPLTRPSCPIRPQLLYCPCTNPLSSGPLPHQTQSCSSQAPALGLASGLVPFTSGGKN